MVVVVEVVEMVMEAVGLVGEVVVGIEVVVGVGIEVVVEVMVEMGVVLGGGKVLFLSQGEQASRALCRSSQTQAVGGFICVSGCLFVWVCVCVCVFILVPVCV